MRGHRFITTIRFSVFILKERHIFNLQRKKRDVPMVNDSLTCMCVSIHLNHNTLLSST